MIEAQQYYEEMNIISDKLKMHNQELNFTVGNELGDYILINYK
jgi:hypothetical protein